MQYIDLHPGGEAMLRNAGLDSTAGFSGDQHPARVWDMVRHSCAAVDTQLDAKVVWDVNSDKKICSFCVCCAECCRLTNSTSAIYLPTTKKTSD
jgi:hypothetical protein